jgi:hypothetical protein
MNKNIDKGDDEDCGCKENGQTEGMGRPMTVLALLNGMIGGASMVLPQIGLKTGWLLTIGVCVFVGFISYYTSYLIVLHLGKCRNIRQCILSHFKQDHRYLTGYGLVLFLSITPTLIIYFKIICLQLEGLMGYHSDWLAPSLAAFMIVVVIIIRIVRVGEETLAYGVISIVAYLIFLLWAQISAPSGPKTVPVAVDPISLTAAMITAFSCHDLLVQNIIKHTKQENYLGIVRWTYVFAVMIFSFITLGSFGKTTSIQPSLIANPEIPTPKSSPTISDPENGRIRSSRGSMSFISSLPSLTSSSCPSTSPSPRLRFYQIFGIQTKCNISWHEVLYIVLGIVICCVVY